MVQAQHPWPVFPSRRGEAGLSACGQTELYCFPAEPLSSHCERQCPPPARSCLTSLPQWASLLQGPNEGEIVWNELILGDLGKPEYAPMTGMSRSRLWGPRAGYEARLLFMSQSRTFVVPAGGGAGVLRSAGQMDSVTLALGQDPLTLQEGRSPDSCWLLSSPSPIPQGWSGGCYIWKCAPSTAAGLPGGFLTEGRSGRVRSRARIAGSGGKRFKVSVTC